MRAVRSFPLRSDSTGDPGDAVLLGHLGSELALIYHDTLQAPLPAALQALIDRLESAIGDERYGANGLRGGLGGGHQGSNVQAGGS
ncbi:MAG: hypothetical protein JWR08_2331 [Enterovirga sp.]|jgi:hypothetical protein|nr:hypothetical protein [Enterovirga sp.]